MSSNRAAGLGAVYLVQREHSDERHRKALTDMAALGFQSVVIWPPVYRWEDASVPGRPYRTGRFLLDEAQKLGLKVVIELAGQIPFGESMADADMKDEYFTRNSDGGADNRLPYYGSLNHFHPEVEALTESYLRDTVRAYRGHPALLGWDLWNETMFVSEDAWTLGRFQTWLKARYGTLDALNDAWDRSFTAWEQVRFSTWMWASVMPQVDWWTFRKQAIGLVLGRWNTIVKEEDPHSLTIADNIHTMLTERWADDRPQDDWVVASCVDQFGISFYPKSGDQPADPVWRSLTFAAARSAARGPFWVSELQTHRKGLLTPGSVVSPEALVDWTTEAWQHGASQVIYWMWEPFTRGWQLGGRGLVDRYGNPTPRSRAVGALNHSSSAVSALAPARAAVYYDSRNADFLRALALLDSSGEGALLGTRSALGAWRTLTKLGIPAAIVVPGDLAAKRHPDLQTVVISWQLLLTSDRSEELRNWVEAGGTLVIDGAFGVLDDAGRSPAVQPDPDHNSWWGWQAGEGRGRAGERVTGEPPRAGWTSFWEGAGLVPGPEAETHARFADGEPAFIRVSRGRGCLWVAGTTWWARCSDREDPTMTALLQECFS